MNLSELMPCDPEELIGIQKMTASTGEIFKLKVENNIIQSDIFDDNKEGDNDGT